MLSRMRSLLSAHFTEYMSVYFIVILCFSIGVAAGGFSVRALNDTQKSQLLDYLISTFQTVFNGSGVDSSKVFFISLVNTVKTVGILWILSILIITFPLIFFVMGIRGFVLGFTVGFLIDNIGYKGMILAMVSILPQNIVIIPILIILSVLSVNFSTSVIKLRKQKRIDKGQRIKLIAAYTFLTFIMVAISAGASFIEAYISPYLLKGLSGYLIG